MAFAMCMKITKNLIDLGTIIMWIENILGGIEREWKGKMSKTLERQPLSLTIQDDKIESDETGTETGTALK